MWRFCVEENGDFWPEFRKNRGRKACKRGKMTRLMRRFTLSAILLICAVGSIAAKDWRGILPLHSTRADVERLMGEPATNGPGLSSYDLGAEEVLIIFAEESRASRDCAVAPGIVLSVRVTSKVERSLNAFNFDERRFRKFTPTDGSETEDQGFINEEEGLVIRTRNGIVEEMVYVASAVDRPRCSDYYSNLESFVRAGFIKCGLRTKFDEYGDLSFSDEKARLDNFAIQLLNDADTRGHIVVYAGRKALVAEAQVRGNRAKHYLLSVREVSPERLIIVDGGHHEDLTVELWILPAELAAPEPMPTVAARDVEIIYEKPKRRGRRNR